MSKKDIKLILKDPDFWAEGSVLLISIISAYLAFRVLAEIMARG